ncbi:MAG: T9SS type A sorting domain-containing protein [Bacteroidetes bacterium]|nr:T9SS type A sorting domain-containing protein [Bacteroidota bacterium]
MRYLFLLLSLCFATTAHSQHYYSFTDYDTTSDDRGNLDPYWLQPLDNGRILFVAYTKEFGTELWTSDGTLAGTHMIKDIGPGALGGQIGKPVLLNHIYYFAANDTVHGFELWRTDGTATGTYMVKDISPGREHSMPNYIVVCNNKLYFSATTPATGTELWTSDGTAAGTHLVVDATPGVATTGVINLFSCNGKVYFVGSDNTNGNEPWVSDGTAAGTHIVKDINPGIYSGIMNDPTEFNGKMFFISNTNSTDVDIYYTDGTDTGTHILKDFVPGNHTAYLGVQKILTVYNGRLYFAANDGLKGNELWSTDGTDTGTHMVKDINPGIDPSDPINPYFYKGKLYFSANVTGTGRELWITDGTTAGTKMFLDINPKGGSDPVYWTEFEGLLFFCATHFNTRNQVYYTDGTDTGTHMTRPSSYAFSPVAANIIGCASGGKLFYNADYRNFDVIKSELWSLQDSIIKPNSISTVQQAAPGIIYPNPNNGHFIINTGTDDFTGTVRIYDVTGKLVQTNSVKGRQAAIILKAPANAMYLLELINDAGGKTVSRLLVE